MDRFLYLTTAFAAVLALSAPAAQAGLGINGPALEGQQFVLPDGSQIVGKPAAEEMNGLHLNGPALDGRQVATPDLAGVAVDRRRPGSAQDLQVQQ